MESNLQVVVGLRGKLKLVLYAPVPYELAWRFHPAPAEELFQSGIHVLFVIDAHADEVFPVLQAIVEDGKQRSGGTTIAR